MDARAHNACIRESGLHGLSLTKKLEITLNQIIESEFESFIGTSKYTHSNNRNITNNGKKIYRNGYRTRKLNTTLGTITLKIPRANSVSFMPSFIERYKRNTNELNHLIQQMYINGISTGKVNKCIKALGVNNISKSQVSRITNKLKQEIELFNTRDLSNKQYDAIYIDATFERVMNHNKEVWCAIITVLGYTNTGNEVISVYKAHNESKDTYTRILNDLKQRGLKTPKLIISDYALGLLKAIHNIFPHTKHQRCKVHFMRNIFQHVGNKLKRQLSTEIKNIWHTSSREVALQRANDIYNKYKNICPDAMRCLKDGIKSTLTYTEFRKLRHRRIETSNPIENLHRQFKQRTQSIGIFPSIESCYKLYVSMALNHSNFR